MCKGLSTAPQDTKTLRYQTIPQSEEFLWRQEVSCKGKSNENPWTRTKPRSISVFQRCGHQNCNHITLDKCPREFSDFSRELQPPPVIKPVSSFRNHKVHLRRQCQHILPPIINSSCFIFYFLYWITVEKVFLPSFLPRWRLRLTWCTTSRFRFLNTVFNKNWAVARSIETASAAVTTTSTTTTQIHTLHICPKRDPNPRSQCYNSTRLRPHNHCRHGLLFLTSHAQRFTYTVNYTLSDDKSTTDSAMYTRNRNSSPKYDMCKLTCCNITCP